MFNNHQVNIIDNIKQNCPESCFSDSAVSEASPAAEEQHSEETLVCQDIGLQGRGDVPQPGLSLWTSVFLNGRSVRPRGGSSYHTSTVLGCCSTPTIGSVSED